MAGALPFLRQGPTSYPAGGYITGGMLVTAATGLSGSLASLNGVGVVQNTTDDSSTILGVAASDANTTNYPEGTPSLPSAASSSTDDNPTLDSSTLNFEVAVYNNVDVFVTYTAAAVSMGALLVANATGGVRAFVHGTDYPEAVVGRCTQPGGVSSAGGTARAFIRV